MALNMFAAGVCASMAFVFIHLDHYGMSALMVFFCLYNLAIYGAVQK